MHTTVCYERRVLSHQFPAGNCPSTATIASPSCCSPLAVTKSCTQRDVHGITSRTKGSDQYNGRCLTCRVDPTRQRQHTVVTRPTCGVQSAWRYSSTRSLNASRGRGRVTVSSFENGPKTAELPHLWARTTRGFS